MSVQFIIDTFHIDSDGAVVAEAEPHAIEQLRNRINQHLKSDNESVLRIRFNSKALFNRFSYFEGLHGVLATQSLIPRSVYRDAVQMILPEWLSNELIIQLGLLDHSIDGSADSDLIDRIIISCSPQVGDVSGHSRLFQIGVRCLMCLSLTPKKDNITP